MEDVGERDELPHEEGCCCGGSCCCCDVCGECASFQCLICLKAGVQDAPVFCGPDCYRVHFASHKLGGCCGGGMPPPEYSTSPNTNERSPRIKASWPADVAYAEQSRRLQLLNPLVSHASKRLQFQQATGGQQAWGAAPCSSSDSQPSSSHAMPAAYSTSSSYATSMAFPTSTGFATSMGFPISTGFATSSGYAASTSCYPSVPMGMATGSTSGPLTNIEGGSAQHLSLQWTPVYWLMYQ